MIRSCFGMAGVAVLLVSVAVPIEMHFRTPPHEAHRIRMVLAFCFVLAASGGVILAAWWRLRTGAPGARGWAIAASILVIPLAGLGTLAGIAGLIVFRNPVNVQAAAISAEPEKSKASRIAGDGTRAWFEHAFVILSVAVLMVSDWLWGRWATDRQIPSTPLPWALIQFAAAYLVSVAVHEAGHIVAGLCVRMRLAGLMVGPFTWKLQEGKWKFEFDIAGSFRGAAGMIPLHLDDRLRRDAVMIAGGPLASMLVAMGAAFAALSAPGSALELVWVFFAGTTAFSIIGGPLNFIPLKVGHSYSDGARIYQALTNGPMAHVSLAMSMVTNSLVTPLRPRDWDTEVLERASAAVSEGMPAILLRIYGALHHLDAHRMPEALDWFDRAAPLWEAVSSEADGDMAAEFLFASALLRRDLEEARLWWRRVEEKKADRNGTEYWRAHAALLWLENQQREALASLAKAEELIRELPSAGAYDSERESLELLRMAIEESQPHRATQVETASE